MKTIILNDRLVYNLHRKKVKNINLRIKLDGTVHVSANNRVPQRVIDEFVLSKADFILSTLEKYKTIEAPKKIYSEDEIRTIITGICKRVYPYFQNRGIRYPQIKFRKMVSRWGSCNPVKGILTFNTALMYAPIECIEYVVVHEFAHFLQANHSNKFYEEVEMLMPDWKARRNKLKEISIR